MANLAASDVIDDIRKQCIDVLVLTWSLSFVGM